MKNAQILFDQLDAEKEKKESRKKAAAKKRDNRKKKKRAGKTDPMVSWNWIQEKGEWKGRRKEGEQEGKRQWDRGGRGQKAEIEGGGGMVQGMTD